MNELIAGQPSDTVKNDGMNFNQHAWFNLFVLCAITIGKAEVNSQFLLSLN